MNGLKNIPGADRTGLPAQADIKPGAHAAPNPAPGVREQAAPTNQPTGEAKPDAHTQGNAQPTPEPTHPVEHKTARLNELDLRRQHVLSRLENPRDNPAAQQARPAPKDAPDKPGDHANKTDSPAQKFDRQADKVEHQADKVERQADKLENRAQKLETQAEKHVEKFDDRADRQAGKSESGAERQARQFERQGEKLENRVERSAEKSEGRAENRAEKFENRAEKLEGQVQKFENRGDNSGNRGDGGRPADALRDAREHANGLLKDDGHAGRGGDNGQGAKPGDGRPADQRPAPGPQDRMPAGLDKKLEGLDRSQHDGQHAGQPKAGPNDGGPRPDAGRNENAPGQTLRDLAHAARELPGKLEEGAPHQDVPPRQGNGRSEGVRGQLFGHDDGPPGVARQRGHEGDEARQEVRRTLEAVSQTVGREAFSEVMRGRGDKVEKFVTQLLRQSGGEGHGPRQAGTQPGGVSRQVVKQAAEAFQLAKHFAQAERTVGRPARQAEDAAWRLLTRDPKSGATPASRLNTYRPAELLHDLRSGAFLPAAEARNPFPLTGRARVASEMIELMHTLDAIEYAMRQETPPGVELPAAALDWENIVRSVIEEGVEMLSEELLAMLPMLPGRAGRAEMLRLLASLNEPLADAQGRTLLSRDGLPLKPERPLLLNMMGGLLVGGFESESFPVRLSPAILHGLDALYSLIGFDGRTLALPHFAAAHVKVNASELEWVFGQPPMSEGWARALIEHLKDNASAELNLLGEMLEDALLDGRFHTLLLKGSVAEGSPVPGSFGVAGLLPGGPAPAFA